MQYTLLGQTGVTVSRICLGCMSFGDPAWRPWALDAEAAKPFFRRAVEAGINFFDTADMYSLGVSEQVTGRWLREFANSDEIVLATKVWFPMSKSPNMGGLSRKRIVQACEASLKRLGVETIDLYQIHRFDPNTPSDETLAWAKTLISNHSDHHQIILVTHAYMYDDDTRLGPGDRWSPKKADPSWNDGEDIWEKLISRRDNVFMVLSGHVKGDDFRGRFLTSCDIGPPSCGQLLPYDP